MNIIFTKHLGIILTLLVLCSCIKEPIIVDDPVDEGDIKEMYFPPLDHSIWEDTLVNTLQWDTLKLNDLYSYLDNKNTKGFIIIKDGKIAVEKYFNGHTINKNWNWFSAGKSLISTLMGIAIGEDSILINDKSSAYLGENWSSAPLDKENLITVENHMTMTTGFVNPIGDLIPWTCTNPSCFEYEVDAGSKWSYHQGAYTLTQDILTNAVGLNFKQYCKQKLQEKIGMNGTWNEVLDIRIFSSTTRSMARFGLLALNEGVWNEEQIYPKDFHELMINTSQSHNKAYGYLWWLNGKSDFLTTQNQSLFTGPLIPNAPSDMFCALGAEDQKIYVVPSLNMVVVRCGEAAGNNEFANSSFDNELWGILSEIFP